MSLDTEELRKATSHSIMNEALYLAADEIDSLRAQLEEQKALVARLIAWDTKYQKGTVYNSNESKGLEHELTEIIEAFKAAHPSAQQDAAILKAAREHYESNEKLVYRWIPQSPCHCFICKAVRGEKEEG